MSESVATAAPASTRCGRPDCISLREELELLRGDLQELESENEQLHDKLSQLEADAQRAAQEHAREQTAAQAALTHKSEEVERLTVAVRELTTALQTAQQQLVRAPASASASTGAQPRAHSIDDASERLARLEHECSALRDANAALERTLTDVRAANASAVAAPKSDARDQRSELYDVLKENEALRETTRELEDALRRTAAVARDNEAMVETLYAHERTYKDALDDQTIEITQLHTKLETLERTKDELERKLIEMDERESDVDALVRDAKHAHERERSVLRTELETLRQQNQQLLAQTQTQKQPSTQISAQKRTETAGVSTDTAAVAAETLEMEKQLELLHDLRVRDKSTIAELTQRMAQQQSDLESLMEHVDTDAAVAQAVDAAVAAERRATERMRHEHASLQARLKEQRSVIHELEARQAQLESALADAQNWNAKYEHGAGLEDVMAFQKQLRKKLEAQTQANVALRHDLNAQLDATGKLHVAFERLKAECGKPAAFEYDDLALDEHLKGALAANNAVIRQLEHELQDLEADRVRLLQKLRDQARVTGHRLYDAHGVTLEQWALVEAFIERVKLTPEVAKRLLQTGASTADHAAVPRQSDSTAVDHDDGDAASRLEATAAVAYETEIAAAHAANRKLMDDVAQLRTALEASQHQVAVLTQTQDDARSRRGDADDLQDIRAQIQQIVQEQAVQRSARDERATESATDCKPTHDADIESLSSVDGESDDEDARDEAPAQASEPRAGVASASTAALPSSPRTAPSDWHSVESIASAVAKALESKLALLQPSTSAQPPQSPSLPPSSAVAPPESERPSSTLASAAPHDAATPQAARVVDALAFESEDVLAQELDVLKELNVALDEVVRVEAQNERLTQQLAEHERAFQAVLDQHTVLYQHFFHLHDTYAARDAARERALRERAHDVRDLELKCERYEATLHTLAWPVTELQHSAGAVASDSDVAIPTETQLRSELIELTRKAAVYEVNDAKYRRKYTQLHHDLVAAQARARALETDWLEMERTLKYRILYLESWKRGADDVIERMERTLEQSVLKTFAERQERAALQLVRKYDALSDAYATMHVQCVQLRDLPQQLSRLEHENALLRAEKRASSGDATESHAASGVDAVLHARIAQLEHELSVQTQRLRDVEDAHARQFAPLDVTSDTSTRDVASDSSTTLDLVESDVCRENALLVERISEVEQLYASLTRECAKYKDIAALAADQANTLTARLAQDKARARDADEHVRELMAASDDHALVGQLQHQVLQLKANYQQFLRKYDRVVDDQQHAAIRAQHLELALDDQTRALSDVRETARHQVAVLETTLSQVQERDWTARTAKWDAFRKRIDALDDALQREQEQRKALEQALEDRDAQLPVLPGTRPPLSSHAAAEVRRLQARVEALETRERVLVDQLERATASATALEHDAMLQAELADTKKLNRDVLEQLHAAQARVSDLIEQHGAVESQRRALAHANEDLAMELEQVRAELELARSDPSGDNQRSASHSPLMRKKVGLYEQDQAALQQAAQATIASLKLLVDEKNSLLREYERQLAAVRLDAAHARAQDRVETTQLNKKLFDENQRMIAQLQDAMATIHDLERTGGDKRALAAAHERHDHAVREWQAAEVALAQARETIRELERTRDVLVHERDLAEARAGEALEEIVLTKDAVADRARAQQQLAQQLAVAKRDVATKAEKLALLRDAVIQLKEEFLKAEDRHAVEVAKAQAAAAAAVAQTSRERRNAAAAAKRSRGGDGDRPDADRDSDDGDERAQWRDDKARLERQVAMLQEKLRVQTHAARKRLQTQHTAPRAVAGDADAAARATVRALEDEVERLKRVVKDRVVGEARALEELEKKVRVLEAQNAALREASSAAPRAAEAATPVRPPSREQWDVEKKLQRRNEILALRLKDKHAEVEARDAEVAQLKDRLEALEDAAQTERKRRGSSAPSGSSTRTPGAASATAEHVADLERQNQFLHETLVLKRREWEDAFTAQQTKYEAEVTRLRRRLSQHGVAPVASGDASADAVGPDRLRREEQAFLVAQEVRDELAVLGDELRTKEQALMERDTRVMALELELESTRLEVKRLQRQAATTSSGSSTGAPVLGPPRAQQRPSGKVRAVRSPAQERQDLQDVIANMKRVIEKLRVENEKLKTQSASPSALERLRRQVRDLRDRRSELERDVERLRHETTELKQDKLRLQHKLRVATSTLTTAAAPSGASHRASATAAVVQDLEAQLQRKNERLAELETNAQELQRSAARNETRIQELQFQLARHESSATDARVEDLEAHIEALERENRELQRELAAFDADFFEEIEDLKYQFASAVREKQRLEQELAAERTAGGSR